LVDSLAQHLRYSLRKLLRAPLFTSVAALTLAVGIGSNVAIFSVVNGVLLEPLPFDEPDRLVGIWHVAPGLGFDEATPVNQSPALHFTYLDEGTAFESVGVWDDANVSITGDAEPEQVPAMMITHQTIPMLGIEPILGRAFNVADDSPGMPETVVLSHGYWVRRFGQDPGVVGRSITIDGRSREIIGVLPAGRFLRSSPDVYLPFQWDRSETFLGNFSYQAVGRLRPEVTIEQANADIERMIPIAVERFPGGLTLGMLEEAGFAPFVRPLKSDVVGDVGGMLWVLLGTVAIVLLIACANVANLFIVRAEGRQREVALRTAIGAERRQIVGQLLTESTVLGAVGGLAGLALAYVGLRLLVTLGPESLPRLDEIGIDAFVLGFAAVISIGAGVLFGLFPALRYGRPDLVTSLKEGGRGGGAGRERHLARNGLVVAQMALALVLLTGSGLMIRSFQALRSVDPGFDAPEEVLTFRVSVPTAQIADPLQVADAYQEMLRRIQAIPGVASASFASSVTMDGYDSNDAIEVEEFPVVGDQLPPLRRFKWVGEGYFDTMGNPVIAGRALTFADARDRAEVVVVTADFAADYWDSPAEAIGKRIRQFGGELGAGKWWEIVGVVGEEHDNGVTQGPVATIYWPQVVYDFWDEEVWTQRSMAFAVRSSAGDPMTLLGPTRQAVWSVNPNLPLARVRPLDEYVDRSMARTSFTVVMLGIAAAVALFLGSVGIYGVVSYVVSQRTREIGVRMAMGAETGHVSRMVVSQALILAAGGVAVGLVGAVGLTRLMSSLLFGVSPVDPVTFAAVALGLSVIALVASYLPARRAARVDPVIALRFD
jgi:putative ABC transport system permease protein